MNSGTSIFLKSVPGDSNVEPEPRSTEMIYVLDFIELL